MANIILFVSSILIVYAGFTFRNYGKFARTKINYLSYSAAQNNIDVSSEPYLEEYARKFEEWRAGSFFDSGGGLILGPVLLLTGVGVNLLENSWWSSILVIIIGYLSYLQLTMIFKHKVQLLSFIVLITGVIVFFLR